MITPLGCSGKVQETETSALPTCDTVTLTGSDGTIYVWENISKMRTEVEVLLLPSSSVLKGIRLEIGPLPLEFSAVILT